MSASHIIRSPSTQRQLNVPGLTAFVVKYAPHYTYALSTTRFIEQTSHPLHETTMRRWAARSDPLWWHCVTSTRVGGSKKCVRGWLNKRSTVAMVEALKRKGYARNGAKLPGDHSGKDLRGSATIVVMPEVFRMKFDTLSKEADNVVASLEKVQRTMVEAMDGPRVSRGPTNRGSPLREKSRMPT